MAKKLKMQGIQVPEGTSFGSRAIVIDSNGVPWIIDPDKGYVQPADVRIPAVKK